MIGSMCSSRGSRRGRILETISTLGENYASHKHSVCTLVVGMFVWFGFLSSDDAICQSKDATFFWVVVEAA
uniref:Uncharacterized protein n=1 Tax=Aegilops tauschii subsp. strangulata TaxID=200361 RepID=A0A453I0Q5_AEGTS